MKYIIILDAENFHGAGSDSTMRTSYKQMWRLRKQAESFLSYSMYGKKAYLINEYTQKMCEMNRNEFSEYIIKNGMLMAVKK